MAYIPNGADFGKNFAGLSAYRNKAFPRIGSPRQLASGVLYPQFFGDTVFLFDDFNDATINTFHWTVAGDTGTTSFAIPAAGSQVHSGIITGATSTDDNEAVSIYGHAVWKGDANCGMAVRWKTDNATEGDYFLEMGFTDPLTDYTLPAINDIDTPTITNGAVTVATLVIDGAQTLKTAAFVGDGDSTYATSKKNLGTWAPTVSKWYTTVIQLEGDNGYCWVYDTNVASAPVLVAGGTPATSIVAGIEGGTLVQPWFIVGNREVTGVNMQIDYIATWGDRV